MSVVKCVTPLGSGFSDAEACHVLSQGPRGKCWVWQLFHENWLSGLEEPVGERRAELLLLKDALNAIYTLIGEAGNRSACRDGSGKDATWTWV